MKILLFLCCLISRGWSADFDCLFVGSSPFSLLEAIYQSQIGKKVIVVESSEECGGAWKTINVCGVPEVDLGCHEIGSDSELESFLTDCMGCRLVSLDNPLTEFAGEPAGFYFSKGCCELMSCLKQLLKKTNITLLLQTRVHQVSIENSMGLVETSNGCFTAERVFITPMSAFSIREEDRFFPVESLEQQSFYHFYLLVSNPSPPSFSYSTCPIPNVYRCMNLTNFTELRGTGKHLLIVQTQSEEANGADLLDALKECKLIDANAVLLKEEFYAYERYNSIEETLEKLTEGRKVFQMLETTRFVCLAESVLKWREVLSREGH